MWSEIILHEMATFDRNLVSDSNLSYRLRCESRTFFIDAVTRDITPGFNYTSDQSFLEFTFSYALSLSLLIGHSKTWMHNMYNCKSTYNCTFTKYVIPRSFTNIVVIMNITIGPFYTTWKILDLNIFIRVAGIWVIPGTELIVWTDSALNLLPRS